MPLPEIKSVTGRGVYVPGEDLDTDQVIPGRFLRCVTFDGLGEHLFEDVRKAAGGKHPLDDPRSSGASVFLTGRNFGCGSSREHAPQSMFRAGIRAVVAESFAEIFFGNAITLGMPCVRAEREDIRRIADAVEKNPESAITVDIEKLEVTFLGGRVPCALPAGARQSLLSGTFDALDALLAGADATRAVAERLPYRFRG